MTDVYIVWICDGGNRFTRVLETNSVDETRKCLKSHQKFTTLLTKKVDIEELPSDQ
jgi:hypothetical protein